MEKRKMIWCIFIFLRFTNSGFYGNLAENKPASQKVTLNMPVLGTYTADRAVDGVRDTRPFIPYDSCALVDKGVATWWKVDLLQPYMITSVAILARQTMSGQSADLGIGIGLLTTGPFSTCLTTSGSAGWINSFATFSCPVPIYGQFVKITKNVLNQYMCLCEVEVYGMYYNINVSSCELPVLRMTWT
ncbi:fucolectin-like [Mizuhopecten yessoensis]|uniref:fucolectin-like n=1 Tax=Mizuhopecten yessoensis TaxID=6573 RepID=UPI000B45E74F|nr:fucolectin-like [Mizuhopecten yessoensis]